MRISLALLFALLTMPVVGRAQVAPPPDPQPAPVKTATDGFEAAPVPPQEELYRKFTGAMENVRLAGVFTVRGREDTPPKREEYLIESVKKLPQGDFWMFKARIRYGDKDVSLPLPLEVKWAGDTPVITLTNFTIPGLGTFDSRVVIHDGKYAGTWTHGNATGHLFGTVERITPPQPLP
ncbi:MAG: hypothetical protein KDA59_21565 [Planctomycetales bacterium]|nr:hypothetical protein [Planctomycetales bacterium]